MRFLLLATFLLTCSPSFSGDDAEAEFEPLFNGRDLTGWVPVNTAPTTWTVEDGMLICSGKPIGELRTERMYQNFILELEWRHMVPKGNAGVFVWADDITARGVPFHRSIEVQVLENAYGNTKSHTTHGDIFPIHGATMEPVNGRGGQRAFPTEERSRPSPEWNHYRITCNDGDISLAVNGKVVTRGRNSSLRKGYICLESEGGVVHYRGLRIKELPETPITDEQTAIADRGYRSLYTGVDLSGWENTTGWQVNDWVLSFTGKDTEQPLTSTGSFNDFGFIVDVRRTPETKAVSLLWGSQTLDLTSAELVQFLSPPGKWDRVEGVVTNDQLTLTINGTSVFTNEPLPAGLPAAPVQVSAIGPVDIANIYVRDTEQ